MPVTAAPYNQGQFVDRGGAVINVLHTDFGATYDTDGNVTNASAVLNAAIASISTLTGPVGSQISVAHAHTLYLPALANPTNAPYGGRYYFSSTVEVRAAHGLRIVGEANFGTELEWVGNASTAAMFTFGSCNSCEIGNFHIAVTSSDTARVMDLFRFETRPNPDGSFTPTAMYLHDIVADGTGETAATGGYVNGARFLVGTGGTDANNDLSVWERVTFRNARNAGWRIESTSTQSVSHQLHDCAVINADYGFQALHGNFQMHGGSFNACRTANVYLGAPNGVTVVEGVDCENTHMILQTAAAGTAPGSASSQSPHTFSLLRSRIAGNKFDEVAGYDSASPLTGPSVVMDYQFRGPLIIEGCTIGVDAVLTRDFDFSISARGAYAVTARGNQFATTQTTPRNPVRLPQVNDGSAAYAEGIVDISNNLWNHNSGSGGSTAVIAHSRVFASGDTTPCVIHGDYFLTASSANLTITDFDEGRAALSQFANGGRGYYGKRFTLHAQDATTTIQSGNGKINLKPYGTGPSYVGPSRALVKNEQVTFMKGLDNIWWEV